MMIDQILAQLKTALLNLRDIIDARMPDPQPATVMSKAIYETAKALLHTDASPHDEAPDSLACAETVNNIVRIATGAPIGGGTSTYAMWQCLRTQARWKSILVSEARPGDIIISPTGAVTNARLEHGHVGIVAKFGILSNNSETGELAENFDIPAWKRYYTQFGLLPTLVYRYAG